MTRAASLRHASTAALLAATALALAPAAARAQEQVGAELPAKRANVRMIERGFYLSLDLGGNLMLTKIDDRSYGVGLVTGIFAGYDFTPFFSVGLGALATVAKGSADNAVAGDLVYLSPMLQVQFALLTSERDQLYLKGGVGLGMGLPETVGTTTFGGAGVAFRGLVGWEHYTKLRHFSVGVAAGVSGFSAPSFALGLTIVPTLKYTF